MWNHRRAFAQKTTRLAVVATMLWVGHNAGFSEELVPSKENRTNHPAKASDKKNLLDFRAYRPSESIFKSKSMDVPSPSVPAPAPPSTRTSKEIRELQDRQKNWILVLPGDEEKTDSMEDLLEVNPGTLDNESKSVLTKFLENKSSVTPTEADGNSFNKNDSRNSAGPPIFGLGNEKRNGFGTFGQPVNRFENPVGNSGAPLSLSERWQQMHGAGAEKAREEKRVQMSEFENLFKSQSGGVGNNLNTFQSNLGLQTPEPTASGLNSLNRNPPASGLRNPVRTLPGANPATSPNINARVFGTDTTVAPTPEPPRQVTQPGVLPIPKRRF